MDIPRFLLALALVLSGLGCFALGALIAATAGPWPVSATALPFLAIGCSLYGLWLFRDV